jgi:hypothetical protein
LILKKGGKINFGLHRCLLGSTELLCTPTATLSTGASNSKAVHSDSAEQCANLRVCGVIDWRSCLFFNSKYEMLLMFYSKRPVSRHLSRSIYRGDFKCSKKDGTAVLK